MGNARYSDTSYTNHVTSRGYHTKSVHETFQARHINAELDPAQIKNGFREAVDSPANPNSTPIILCSDVTGSMGILAHELIKDGLGKVFRQLYDRKPVSDPQILCAAVGDVNCDQAPLQVTQFEADGVALASQLEKAYVESGGGGNNGESYTLVWLFAALMTKTDSFMKRGRKGYIFTIGDEQPHTKAISTDQIARFLGRDIARNAMSNLDAQSILAEVTKSWNIFHLIVKPVVDQPVEAAWKGLLGSRAVVVEDIDRIADGIVACIEMTEGRTKDEVVKGRTGSTAITVSRVADQLATV